MLKERAHFPEWRASSKISLWQLYSILKSQGLNILFLEDVEAHQTYEICSHDQKKKNDGKTILSLCCLGDKKKYYFYHLSKNSSSLLPPQPFTVGPLTTGDEKYILKSGRSARTAEIGPALIATASVFVFVLSHL